jgi:hypothetical protein
MKYSTIKTKKGCNNMKPNTHHEHISSGTGVQYMLHTLSCKCPTDSLKLIIVATANPNPHYLPNIDMLLQLK